MTEKGYQLSIGKKIKVISDNDNKSLQEVSKQFYKNVTLEEQHRKLSNYIKEKGYKGKRSPNKEKKESEIKFEQITLDVQSINVIINSVKSDAEKLDEIKKIISKVIENNEIVELRAKIETQEKILEESKKELADKIKKLG